jgi:hypothetical protein
MEVPAALQKLRKMLESAWEKAPHIFELPS